MRAVRLRAWCNATIKTLRRAARNQYVDGAMAQEDGDLRCAVVVEGCCEGR
jgi:hypothetical protein